MSSTASGLVLTLPLPVSVLPMSTAAKTYSHEPRVSLVMCVLVLLM